MREIIIVIDILSAVGLIALVLLQQGKGADIGAAFGAGASQTLFGARGSANFLTRATAVLATVFFISNIALAWIATREQPSPSVVRSVLDEPAKPAPEAPPAPTVPPLPPVPPKGPEAPAQSSPGGTVPEVPR